MGLGEVQTVATGAGAGGLESRFLEAEAITRLGHLRFVPRTVVEGPFAGRHESHLRGGAVEFVDFRQYTPGEDLRHLDWKVLARLGRPFVRIFANETNLVATIVLDVSRSMLFAGEGGRGALSKLDYARYLAAALSFVITRGEDQVGLALSAGGLREYLPSGSTPSHLGQLLRLLEQVEPVASTRMGVGLRELFPLVRRRGVLVILSDFLDEDLAEVFAAVRLFRHRHFEVLLVHVVHPQERELPEGPAFRFEGLEGDGVVSCRPADVRDLYRRRFRNFERMVAEFAVGGGCDYRSASTSLPYVSVLKGLLVERRG